MSGLECFFCNVGDGDAAILTERRDHAPSFTVMVDTGRPLVDPVRHSRRKEALYHLRHLGIEQIDLLFLSHLHIDHIDGAERILAHIPVRGMLVPYLPPAGQTPPSPSFIDDDKTRNSLKHTLNLYADLLAAAGRAGCPTAVWDGASIRLTETMLMEILPPPPPLRQRQKAVLDALFRGEEQDPALVYQVAKEQNAASAMTRFLYRNRSLLLCGDRYAGLWQEAETRHADVVKLPHHGDARSMTASALKSLSPSCVVISCENDAPERKGRPDPAVLSLLKKHVSRVFCTENRAVNGFPAATYDGIRVTIDEAGRLSCRCEPDTASVKAEGS